jgi:hypothetical protein
LEVIEGDIMTFFTLENIKNIIEYIFILETILLVYHLVKFIYILTKGFILNIYLVKNKNKYKWKQLFDSTYYGIMLINFALAFYMVDIFYNEIIWNIEILDNTNLDNYYLISIILRFTLFSLNKKKVLYFVKKMVEFKNRKKVIVRNTNNEVIGEKI